MIFDDSELIMLIREKNEDAEEILNKKYIEEIKKIIGYHFSELRSLNVNIDELIINCQELLNKALEQYNSLYNASFKTYVYLIIKRKIKKTIIKVLRDNKKSLENNSLSLEDVEKFYIIDSLDPLDEMCKQESNKLLKKIIINTLNQSELNVFSYLINGKRCSEIAIILNKNYSQVYRNIQNIKKKLAPELKMFTNYSCN